ncbi:hypothetical protein J0895_23230 [Phormidium pseudopriestleyi FRX01]|uniref:Secreted protein n=1 Tax=Phormidium pseudopriestleyi FRX01 TaxID=1759528 RepID=A0ABS3G018_9CYAN|nr:hypothetical protein [Phormidium pseudopriestleyi]MBO0351942.1 hypothetical protein [Phormidium pseudopriestleyi FRX01]
MVLSSLKVFLRVALHSAFCRQALKARHQKPIQVSGAMPLWVTPGKCSLECDRHITIGFYIKSRTQSNFEIKIYQKREKSGSILPPQRTR